MRTLIQRALTITFLTISLVAASLSHAATPVDNSLAPMLQSVLPAVVNIKAQIKVTDINTLREIMKQKGRNQQDDDADQLASGVLVSVASGVIVDAKNGYILTNAHVVS